MKSDDIKVWMDGAEEQAVEAFSYVVRPEQEIQH